MVCNQQVFAPLKDCHQGTKALWDPALVRTPSMPLGRRPRHGEGASPATPASAWLCQATAASAGRMPASRHSRRPPTACTAHLQMLDTLDTDPRVCYLHRVCCLCSNVSIWILLTRPLTPQGVQLRGWELIYRAHPPKLASGDLQVLVCD